MRDIPRLVYVTDRRSARYPLPDMVRLALAGGVDIVQIREKDLNGSELRPLLVSILDGGADPNALMINGYPELAQEFGIGLHLPEARPFDDTDWQTLGLVSRSVHAPDRAANAKACNFVIAGHVFATASKPRLPPLGLEGLSRIADVAKRPVLAIGGLTPERVPSVLRAGAHGIAVLSGINASADPAAAAHTYRVQLESQR